ncbi:GNAT family N-acetyltransferase [Candidatus Woesearchaeota archaeon]|jgi:GNAT superfamily N-acetyltransferase|nr:GNAT family N-acetyltransferase [Candidatus Woesearchaeota archaeon]MBT3537139.1 GNAT family N-acetyltransferase [Candidatus Woesearchaeota archaeon]MBT4697734.1 GNAT family N-acetyltransferase [Candidatus Woesearchaeota archaeon]MBT7106551.1 GNAT family N-acetyltransferase [Candidatus Woesearchaeota archaeon]MBT7931074.1 GNAT family N-acetyltransferase [Candidatus Woesearchaeota archaeon]
MNIRQYKYSDRSGVEKVQFETGFIGKSMAELISIPHMWNEKIYYYLDKESKNILVLEDKGEIVGYALGCFQGTRRDVVLPTIKYSILNIFRLIFLPEKDKIFWKGKIKAYLKIITGISSERSFKLPKGAAHLHINLLPEARGGGLGSKLLKRLFSNAKSKGVDRIYACSYCTSLNPNDNFWFKNGFSEFSKVRTMFWVDQYPDENIDLVCYLKDL